VLGSAATNATVSIWTDNGLFAPTYRKGDYFRGELGFNNSTGSLWLTITNIAAVNTPTNDIVTNTVGHAFVPQTPESFGYDLDGNLTNDGRWVIAWDAENRASSFTSLSATPAASRKKVECAYDLKWRRVQKISSTWNGSAYAPQFTNRFIYDGWNLTGILDGANTVLYSFTWGNDLSGTEQGAGGIGGLISMRVHTGALSGTYFYAFDGNGNVTALVNAADSTIAARYEYGPFGELLRATGPLASLNPFRFSTKYQDDETGFLYYGYRYYDPGIGRWQSRDPIGEKGGKSIYSFVQNRPTTSVDKLGRIRFGDENYMCISCFCRSFSITHKPAGETDFDWYVSHKLVDTYGNSMSMTWQVIGDPRGCVYQQLEKGYAFAIGPNSEKKENRDIGDIHDVAAARGEYGEHSFSYYDDLGIEFYPDDARGNWGYAFIVKIEFKCIQADGKAMTGGTIDLKKSGDVDLD
jgi:RHS repeat-associated protein